LERSKTSGPDKATKILPIYVSREAWIEDPLWLSCGQALLSGELGFDRDYLVPLPDSNLEGTCGLKAQYSDALGLTRELLRRLPQAEDNSKPLLSETASRFWSEHSDRAGCSGWLASLGVPADQRGFLGRWAVTPTADQYVRVAIRVVENLQNMAAKAARRSLRGGCDFFGEEAVLEDLRRFLLTKGFSNAEADEQVRALTAADASLPVPFDPRSTLQAEDEEDEAAWCQAASAQLDLPEAEPDDEAMAIGSPPGAPEIAEEIDLEQISLKSEAAAREAAELAAMPHGFVIAKTKKGLKTLHFVGNCGKVPGEHYKSFDVWGDMLPPASEIDDTCKVCFRGDKGTILVRPLSPGEAAEVEELATSTSSSSPSSDSEAGSDGGKSSVLISPRKRPKVGAAPSA
jgi:hypothetical protein